MKSKEILPEEERLNKLTLINISFPGIKKYADALEAAEQEIEKKDREIEELKKQIENLKQNLSYLRKEG